MVTTIGCSSQMSKNNTSTVNTTAAISASDISASSKQTSSSKSPNKVKLESFAAIDMVTIDTGYAITKEFHVLKTSDGGSSWTDILTINSSNDSSKPALFALNDKMVYVASYTASGIEVGQSTDAGKNWSKFSIKMQIDDFNSGYGGSLTLSFINESDGFLLTSGLPAAGLMGKALYKTSDGGKDWAYVGESQNSEQGAGDLTGINGYTTGMAFFHSGTGYITCTYHGQKEISVYKTADMGKSWSAVAVSLPKQYASLAYDKGYYVDAYPPAVYGKGGQSAKMELYFCHDEERYSYIYSSDNAGTTWRIDGISNLLMKKYCFVDDKNGLGLDETGTLYSTNNGGIFWSKI